jgi:hypothetical protein
VAKTQPEIGYQFARTAARNKQLIVDSLSSKGYLGRMPAKGAPKRQKAPFGPSLGSLGARRPCLATLLRPFSRGSHQPLRGDVILN